jgi:type II secretory pathway pseudopilin PulG
MLETLVVMVIVGLMAGIVLVQVKNWREKVVLTEVIQDARTMGSSVVAASAFFATYQPITTAGNPVVISVEGTKIGSLTRTNKITGYLVGDNDFTFSIYNGASPETANAFATYNAKRGGVCASGFGPVQACKIELASPNPTATPGNPAPPVPAPSSGSGATTPAPTGPAVAEANVLVAARPGPIAAAVCPATDPLVANLKASRAPEAVLPFSWDASPGADSYVVELSPILPGNLSAYKFSKQVTGTSTTFALPRQSLDAAGNPTGTAPAEYGAYSLRIVPVRAGVTGEPFYRVFNYSHAAIACSSVTPTPEDSRVSPLGQIPAASITKTSVRNATYEDITFKWGAASGATRYKFTLVSTKSGTKWGTEKYVTDTSITVRLPRGTGETADFYDVYDLLIVPQTSAADGDVRVRQYRHFHSETGSIVIPPGKF